MHAQANIRSLALAALLASTSLAAQTIDAYRYWIDGDAANATTNTASGTVFTLGTPIPTNTLDPGFHTITLQFRDSNGAWSAPVERYFTKSGEGITAYRYWFDNDVANAVNTTVTSTNTFNLSSAIGTNGLSVGIHKVSMAFRNGDGSWSTIVERYFSKTGADLTAWQYWFDDNVAQLVETNVGPNTTVNVTADLDGSALPWGDHTLTWRMRDALGNWSVPVVQDFYLFTGIEELPGLQQVMLFPNPADDAVRLRFDGDHVELSMDVVDATGRTVIGTQRVDVQGTAVRTIDLSALTAGSYHVRLQGENGVHTLPLIKR